MQRLLKFSGHGSRALFLARRWNSNIASGTAGTFQTTAKPLRSVKPTEAALALNGKFLESTNGNENGITSMGSIVGTLHGMVLAVNRLMPLYKKHSRYLWNQQT